MKNVANDDPGDGLLIVTPMRGRTGGKKGEINPGVEFGDDGVGLR